MNWLDVVFFAVCGFSAVAYTVFSVAYGAAFRWEKSGEGRSLMAVSASQAVLGWVYVVRRIDEMVPSFSLAGTPWMNTIICTAWLTTGLVAVWRIAGLLRRDKGDE